MVAEYVIDLKSWESPHRKLPYRAGPGYVEVVKYIVEMMLKIGVIERTTTPWASPVVLEPNTDGYYLFCVEYRLLNDITVRDKYPLPRGRVY